MDAYANDQQWSVLASARRIEASTVERIAADATRTGTIVGVRIAEASESEEDAAPWTRSPSGTPRARRIRGPMPNRVSAVLAQRLFVAKEGIPSPLLNQIKRLAAFQNPEFYKSISRLTTCSRSPPAYRFDFTPKHGSCRKQVEIWFGISARSALQHRSFVRVAALATAIYRFGSTPALLNRDRDV